MNKLLFFRQKDRKTEEQKGRRTEEQKDKRANKSAHANKGYARNMLFCSSV
ncbi:hypothetical protein NXX53_24595 [Bacteroides salyersiae]|nr:hypothetical protein [Bacteroides salyersiae]